MNAAIIRNWNQRVKENDIVYHLGDFCFKGGKEGGKTKAEIWEKWLNGKIIHILGNHDDNNGVKSVLTNAIFKFGGRVILVQHTPPTMNLEVPEFVDFVLCGHIHEKWKHNFIEDNRNEKIPILLINVGVDVWNFRPVKLMEIIVYYDKIIKEKNYKRKTNE